MDILLRTSSRNRCVVKSVRIFKLRQDVGTAAVIGNSRYKLLASFRTKFRGNNFVMCFYIRFFNIFSFPNCISNFTAINIKVKQSHYRPGQALRVPGG
jgi:hypothetical protein